MSRFTALFLALILLLTPLFALAEEADTETLDALMDFVQEALDRGGYELYERDDEAYCYALGFGSSDDRLGNLYAYLDVYEHGILIVMSYEQDLPTECIDEAIRFVNLVNSELLGSKYYIDPDIGSICYEIFLRLDFLAADLLDETVQDTLLDVIYATALELNYDVDYFMELIGGESAGNAFAMYLADLEK